MAARPVYMVGRPSKMVDSVDVRPSAAAYKHRLIGASGNRLLASYTAIVHATSRAASLVPAERLERAIDEHEAILRAVCGRDGEQSEHAARNHVRSTVDALS